MVLVFDEVETGNGVVRATTCVEQSLNMTEEVIVIV